MKLEFDSNASAPTVSENGFLNKIDSEKNHIDLTELLNEGIKAAQNGRRAEARSFLLNVTESDPDNEAAWLWLASISEYPEELLGFLNHILKINPENERALTWRSETKSLLSKTFVQRGIDASKENRKDFARQCFKQALLHNEQSDMAWLWLAACADSDEEKIGYLQKVLNINPENESARASLDAIRRQSAEPLLQQAFEAAAEGENERASELLEEVMSLDAGLENAWMLKANLAQSVGEKLECFEKVLQFNPENNLAAANLEFLRSMNSKLEVNEIEAQDAPAADFAKLDEVDFVEDNSPTGDLEFPQELVAEESNFAEESKIDLYEQSEVSAQELEAFDDPFDSAQIDEAVSFDDTDNEPKSENLGEAQDLLQVYTYEESERDVAEKEIDFSVHETEAASYYSDFARAQGEKSEDEMLEVVSPEAFEDQAEAPEADFEADSEKQDFFREEPEESWVEESAPGFQPETFACPFCDGQNESQTFACGTCRAVYSLSDLEMLLAPVDVDKEAIADAVLLTEAEHRLRELDSDELKFLAVGHFNLGNPQLGVSYLNEAARMNPDDILLGSQVNALKIRLAEIEKQQSIYDSQPKNMTILVADDSPTVRKLISGKLEKSGHTVVCAIDGVDALEKLKEIEVDLILLDINMPRMDGYQVCKHIRGNDATKDVPVVMISGKDGFFDKVRGRMAGTSGYITKPFGPETLMKTVETYVMQPA